MGITKITRNFQITLPRDIRKMIKLSEGDEVVVTVEGKNIVMKKAEGDPVKAAMGILESTNETGQEYQKRVRKQWRKRQMESEW